MKFSEFDTVELIEDMPSEGLKKGCVGAIIMVHSEPSEAYEVEFADLDGRTVAQLVLFPHQLKKA